MITIRASEEAIPTLFGFFSYDDTSPPIYVAKAQYANGYWLVMVIHDQNQEVWDGQWPVVATVTSLLDAALALMTCESCIPRIYIEGRA